MPEWLVERGIGETRAALVERGEIVEARIELEDALASGSIVAAKLINTGISGRNAVARDEAGNEYLLPRGAPGITEGAPLMIEVTRQAIPGSEPWKRALARIADKTQQTSSSPVEQFKTQELTIPGPRDVLGDAGWNELLEQARTGIVQFDGGELRISPTPAMTLIDVDGYLPAEDLAVVGAAEAAKAVRRLDIGGSIGIDLPTVSGKAPRQSAAAAIDAQLPQPFERTAVNGFGFVQIIRPRTRASFVELAQERAEFEARELLRRLAFEPAGSKRLVAHPAIIKVLEAHSEWIDAFARQIGGTVSLRVDAPLPMSGGYAEAV